MGLIDQKPVPQYPKVISGSFRFFGFFGLILILGDQFQEIPSTPKDQPSRTKPTEMMSERSETVISSKPDLGQQKVRSLLIDHSEFTDYDIMTRRAIYNFRQRLRTPPRFLVRKQLQSHLL